MRLRYATALLCSAGWLSGCSLTSGFNDYKFGSSGSGAADGGGLHDAGPDANGGRGGNDATTPFDAGTTSDSGAHDAGMPSDGGTNADASTDAGVLGLTCDTDEECGDVATFHCVLRHCLLRRGPSSLWFSGGGGIVRSPGSVMRISVGMPAPMGVSSSKHYSITVGPGAGRP